MEEEVEEEVPLSDFGLEFYSEFIQRSVFPA